MLRPVPFQNVRIDDRFWSPRVVTNRLVTLPSCLDKCDETGRVRNFAVAGGLEPGEHEGRRYNDSDVYKVIEGAAYSLAAARDEALERRVDDVIEKIASAQQADGYINTWITLTAPAERWSDIYRGHELYCAGHLIEAGIAWRQATGKSELFDVARRSADHILDVFGDAPAQRKEPPGHQEIELALVKLYDATGDERYLRQARFFLEQRGKLAMRESYGAYCQDHARVNDQREAVGHAVRAMYQYCGMCDVAARTGDHRLVETLDDLWTDVTLRKMYVTGGIGSSSLNEGFTAGYDLPNELAYCETCASIGLTLWAERMFRRRPDAVYLDVAERSLYNALIAGVSLEGDRYFYDNPLASRGGKHRAPWFDCSCCPTNVVRYLASLGDRILAVGEDRDLYIAQYIGSESTVSLGDGAVINVLMRSALPWSGEVSVEFTAPQPTMFAVHLRAPEWAGGRAEIRLNGDLFGAEPERGFVTICREWRSGDRIEIDFPMTVERVYADPRVAANVGRVAVRRGPIVYCAEGVDHDEGGAVSSLRLPREARLEVDPHAHVFNGAPVITAREAARAMIVDGVERLAPAPLRLIPYHLWDHRAPGEMQVWLRETDRIAVS